jgi:hypothetical protein
MQVVLHVWRGLPVLRLLPGECDVGRSPDCHIRLTQNPVSRRHCRLTVGADRVTIRDLGSRNHTFVNNRRVTAEQPLADDDELAICDTRIRIQIRPDDHASFPGWCTLQPGEFGVTIRPWDDAPADESPRTFKTPTRVYVSGPPILWSPDAPAQSGERALEDDLFRFLGPAAYPDSEGHEGPGLGIPLLLYGEADLDSWGRSLVDFLADWGAPDGTAVSLTGDVPGQGVVHQRFAVPSRTSRG